jgi:hypothetical protein
VSLGTAVPTTPPAVALALAVSDGVAGLTTSGSTWPPGAAVREAARSCGARCRDADSWPPCVSPTGFWRPPETSPWVVPRCDKRGPETP